MAPKCWAKHTAAHRLFLNHNQKGKLKNSRVKILTAIAFPVASIVGASAQVHVDGYYRKDGTYVQPHGRSSPNSTASDSWSTRSNFIHIWARSAQATMTALAITATPTPTDSPRI
jgi:hypothetical protein